jgi:hypothetical protein
MNLDGICPFSPLPGMHYNTRGVDHYGKFGYNDAVGAVFEDIWSPGGLMTYFSDLRTILIQSDSEFDAPAQPGAGAVEIWALDDQYQPLRIRVTLNGLTPVVLPAQAMRIFRAFVLSAGATGANIGNLTLTDQTTALVMAEIPAGTTSTLMSQYTIPAGFTGFLTEFNVAAGQQPDAAQVAFLVRPPDASFRGVWGALPYRNNIRNERMYFARIPEQSDITVRAANMNPGTIACQTDYAITLIKNERLAVIENEYRPVDLPWPVDPIV